MKLKKPIDEVTAITIVKAFAPETESTFKMLTANRYCNGTRYWTIVDIQNERNCGFSTAKRTYNRHLKKIQNIFL